MVRILAGAPIRVVAALRDTSVAMLEGTYSRHIADISDALARKGLLDTTAALVEGNIVPLAALATDTNYTPTRPI